MATQPDFTELPDPVDLGRQFGHLPAPDPDTPERWMCSRCGAAVWRDGGGLNGPAVRERCPDEATVIPVMDEEDDGDSSR